MMVAGLAGLLTLAGCQKGSSNQNAQLGKNGLSTGIINGVDANGTEPFAASVIGIGTKSGNGFSIYCSGTLINNNTVVTAAHCMTDVGSDDYVVFGLQENGANVQGRKIVRSAYHEKYNAWAQEGTRDLNDIGMAQFTGGLPANARPAQLLPDDTILQNGTNILLVGYGVNNGSTQSGSGILRYTEAPIAEFNYGTSEIRTDEKAHGSCNGDSGGPGFVHYNGKYYLWGATSRGDARCVQEGIYTKVTAFRSWMDSKVAAWKNMAIDATEVNANGEAQPVASGF